MPRPARSLKARALQWLAQREQSRAELRRRLLPFAVAETVAEQASGAEPEPEPEFEPGSEPVPASRPRSRSESLIRKAPADFTAGGPSGLSAIQRVEAVLDWLEAHRFQSQTRFVESRVHARSARFGNLRIRHELRQHELGLPDEAAQALAETELERAGTVRERRFGAVPPASAADRARQSRFLAGRGFSPEVIGRVMRAVRTAAASSPSSAPDLDPGGEG